ncbi:MAG: dual specificity protein phosphatase family protein [Pseudomonadota bacterium]
MTHQRYPVPCPHGALSMMACPPAAGRQQRIGDLAAQGVTHVVSLLSPDETRALHMADMPGICTDLHMQHWWFPIADYAVPQMADFKVFIMRISTALQAGASVVIHCRAGVGRSGLTAACTLVALGQTPDAARQIVSKARGMPTPETPAQVSFISGFAENLRH